jgi:hypothetical protein
MRIETARLYTVIDSTVFHEKFMWLWSGEGFHTLPDTKLGSDLG